MPIYTRTGDDGVTGLFGGGRVAKDALRVEAYGAVDELNASVGVARATAPADWHADALAAVQGDLFAIGAQLASPAPEKVAAALEKAQLAPGRIAALETSIDRADEELPPLTTFVLPGGTPKSAALHYARTVCRRAERRVVTLAREETVPSDFVVYLNRLSDALFTWARLANHHAGVEDISW